LKHFIDFSKIATGLEFLGSAAWAFVSALSRLLTALLLIVGLGHMIQYYGLPKRFSPPPAPYQNILLDDNLLIRCRNIDRGQSSCTLLSDCQDGVDRCVITYEVLRQLTGLDDPQPEEK
jgi:hypothetical protein